jgi:hypothetical protein
VEGDIEGDWVGEPELPPPTGESDTQAKRPIATGIEFSATHPEAPEAGSKLRTSVL